MKVSDNAMSDFCWSPETAGMAKERLPRRRNLAGETAATLKEWIRAGVLKEVLPGELRLKTHLGVGRDTLRLALKRLTQEGWASPPAKGKRRRIQGGFPPAGNRAADPLPVTVLLPRSGELRLAGWELEGTQFVLAAHDRDLRFVSPRNLLPQQPGRQLERLVRAHPSAAWILYLADEAIQRWFAQRRHPALLYGLPADGVDLPFVAPDWEHAAFHAGIQLVRHGHQLIGLLEGADHHPVPVARCSLERALAAAEPKGRLAIFTHDGSPVSVAQSLQSVFCRQERPTALVLTQADQLLTCYSWLASRGIRVPAEVSLISLNSDRWFAALHPPVCHYQPDFHRIVRHLAERVLELAATGRVVRKSLRIRLKYVRGATLGGSPANPPHSHP